MKRSGLASVRVYSTVAAQRPVQLSGNYGAITMAAAAWINLHWQHHDYRNIVIVYERSYSKQRRLLPVNPVKIP
jgi:hypothetical protein